MDGMVTFHPATGEAAQHIVLSDTQVDTAIATGLCQADITEVGHSPASVPPPREGDLLPVDMLLAYDLSADCRLSALTVGTETFQQVSLISSRISRTMAGRISTLTPRPIRSPGPSFPTCRTSTANVC